MHTHILHMHFKHMQVQVHMQEVELALMYIINNMYRV